MKSKYAAPSLDWKEAELEAFKVKDPSLLSPDLSSQTVNSSLHSCASKFKAFSEITLMNASTGYLTNKHTPLFASSKSRKAEASYLAGIEPQRRVCVQDRISVDILGQESTRFSRWELVLRV